ncbi:type II secretion system protein [Candidatus Parcubacteria bacterium]|nr:type II secretion system protein [Candidatus Parcubacteria bacterium]
MPTRFAQRSKGAGFTLVELLIVFAIIGILLTAAVSSYQLARVRSRDGKRATDLNQISIALALYEGKYHQFPADIYAPSGGSPPGLAPEFMGIVPRDPLGGVAYAYAVPVGRNEYHLGATVEGADSALRDADSDFDSASLDWGGGFIGGDGVGPCVAGQQQGIFCYDIVEQK